MRRIVVCVTGLFVLGGIASAAPEQVGASMLSAHAVVKHSHATQVDKKKQCRNKKTGRFVKCKKK